MLTWGLFMVAAQVLDSALLRPGRFDRQVTVDRPDVAGRVQILKVHARGKQIGKDVDFDKVSRRTPGALRGHPLPAHFCVSCSEGGVERSTQHRHSQSVPLTSLRHYVSSFSSPVACCCMHGASLLHAWRMTKSCMRSLEPVPVSA
jgi:hypothetical protein